MKIIKERKKRNETKRNKTTRNEKRNKPTKYLYKEIQWETKKKSDCERKSIRQEWKISKIK